MYVNPNVITIDFNHFLQNEQTYRIFNICHLASLFETTTSL